MNNQIDATLDQDRSGSLDMNGLPNQFSKLCDLLLKIFEAQDSKYYTKKLRTDIQDDECKFAF
jgi:hypothetical protein